MVWREMEGWSLLPLEVRVPETKPEGVNFRNVELARWLRIASD
jgi:hypothetical protein